MWGAEWCGFVMRGMRFAVMAARAMGGSRFDAVRHLA